MFLGFDVGGTKVLSVLVDDAGGHAEVRRTPTPPDLDGLLAVLRERVAATPGLSGVGIGVPGPVSPAGTVLEAPNLPSVVGLDADRLTDALGVPVALGNDATCAALAEWRLGHGRDLDDLALVTLGTGIGGGLVVGGRLVLGAHGRGSEIGHLLVARDGRACPCGQRGCWERYASGTALGELAASLDDLPPGGDTPGHRLLEASRAGHPGAVAAVDDWAAWVATGIVGLLNVLDPSLVVLGGGVTATPDAWLPRVRHHVTAAFAGTATVGPPSVEVSAFGPEAGALGAALLHTAG